VLLRLRGLLGRIRRPHPKLVANPSDAAFRAPVAKVARRKGERIDLDLCAPVATS